MKLNVPIICTVLCLSAVLVGTLTAQDAPKDAGEAADVRWQHMAMTVDLNDDQHHRKFVRQLSQVQNDGWELVDVENFDRSGTTIKTVYYFKKPK